MDDLAGGFSMIIKSHSYGCGNCQNEWSLCLKKYFIKQDWDNIYVKVLKTGRIRNFPIFFGTGFRFWKYALAIINVFPSRVISLLGSHIRWAQVSGVAACSARTVHGMHAALRTRTPGEWKFWQPQPATFWLNLAAKPRAFPPALLHKKSCPATKRPPGPAKAPNWAPLGPIWAKLRPRVTPPGDSFLHTG